MSQDKQLTLYIMSKKMSFVMALAVRLILLYCNPSLVYQLIKLYKVFIRGIMGWKKM